MRKTLLIALLLLCTPAFTAWGNESNLDKANGKWVCDPMATIALHPSLHGPSPSQELAEAMFGVFTMRISSKDKSLSIQRGSMSEVVEFTVTSDSDKTLVLDVHGSTVHIAFSTDDSIMMENKERPDSKVIFNRMK